MKNLLLTVEQFIEFKVEHVKMGYLDIYGKGNKLRRIYIPKLLQEEALDFWLRNLHQNCNQILVR